MRHTDWKSQDDVIETSFTFETAAEAKAFLFGFRAAASDGIVVGGSEEPFAIEVDITGSEAAWLRHSRKFREEKEVKNEQ